MGVSQLLKGLPEEEPEFLEPMKCRLLSDLPSGDPWVYEIKFDGVRALAIKHNRSVDLLSRNHKSLDQKYPGVVRAISNLKCKSIILDGEVVALDELGRSSFQLLQNVSKIGSDRELYYYVFDILHLNGRSTTTLPLTKRKELLDEVLAAQSPCIRLSGLLPADARTLQEKMSGMGLEGLIAKKRDSKYEPGIRSGAWVKFKWSNEQEFVVGGWTEPEGSRKFFGSILVGYYQGSKLLYAAKVGTGFDENKLRALSTKFSRLSVSDCPFSNLPGRNGVGLSRAEMRRCHWVEPRLVCQVRFTEWTKDGHLRQPVFLGLRDDKSPADVVREIAG